MKHANSIVAITHSDKINSYRNSIKQLLKLVAAHPGTGSVSMVAVYLVGSKPVRIK